MAITKEAKAIVDRIYTAYGSDTGYLFGIPPALRGAVEGIVQTVLDIEEEAKTAFEQEAKNE